MAARAYLAELVGTFLFLTIGYLSVPAFAAASAPTPNLLVVPFSFGLGLLAAIFAVGHISGGHFNPAVTIAMVLDKRTPPMDAVGYIIAQIIGAIAAGLVVLVTINQAAVAAGITKPGGGVTDIGALILEIVGDGRLPAGHPGLDAALVGPGRAGDPADARGVPLRPGHAERLVAQPGALDRLGAGRWRHEPAVDLSRRSGHRRHHRLGRLARHRWWRRGHRSGAGAVGRGRGRRR